MIVFLHLCFVSVLNYRMGVAMLLELRNQHHSPVYLPGGVLSPTMDQDNLLGMGQCCPAVRVGGHGGAQREVAGTRHTQASEHLQEGTQPLL